VVLEVASNPDAAMDEEKNRRRCGHLRGLRDVELLTETPTETVPPATAASISLTDLREQGRQVPDEALRQ
jgi:hypothetical protein